MTITVGIKNFRSYLTNDQGDPEGGFFKFRFDNGVNLLKGGSGAGKSTVLMAISWCLYKKPALGNTPLYKDSRGGETTVFFHVEDEIRVVRRSPGSLLTVQILDDPSEPTLENEEAQNYIYRRFGRETVWKTCNYVQQGSTNPMISGELNEAQRWDVLYGITLDTDPQNRITIDRLKNALKVQLETCSKTRAQRETELNIYSQDLLRKREEDKNQTSILETVLQEYPEIRIPYNLGELNWKHVRGLFERAALKPYVGEGEIENHRSKIQVLQEEIDNIHRDLLLWETELESLRREGDQKIRGLEYQREIVLSELKPSRTRLETQREKLRRCREVRDLVREMCGKKVGTNSEKEEGGLFNYLDQLKAPNFSEYHRRIHRLFGTLIWMKNVLKTYTLADLQIPAEEVERKISQHGFVERSVELKSKIAALEETILGEKEVGEDLRRVLTERACQEWFSHMPTDTTATLSSNQIVYAIACPCCEKKIRTVFDKTGQKNPVAEPWSDSPKISKGVIEKIRYHDVLVQTLRDVPVVDKPEGSKDRWMRLLPKTETWNKEPPAFQKIVLELLPLAEKISESAFSRFQELQTSQVDLDLYQNPNEEPLVVLEGEIAKMEEGLTNVEREIRDTRRDHEEKISQLKMNRLSQLTIRKVERESEMKEQRRRLEETESVRKLWREISSQGFPDEPISNEGFVHALKTIEETLERRKRLQTELVDSEEKTRLAREELDGLTGRQETIQRLQMRLEQVESDVLAESVRRISGSANEFLENCFDNPMLVQLTTEKESRGGKTKKHSVNLSIKSGKKDGNLLERGLDGFSGGETDRISLGFSSAITGFSPFPMLLLDECISSLDSDMKDKTIRALRQQAKRLNKTIVLVCHDAVEGLFDHVCELE